MDSVVCSEVPLPSTAHGRDAAMRDLMGHLGGEDGENEEAAVGDAREAVAGAVDILWEPVVFTRSSVVFTWQSSWRSRHDPFLRRAAAASNYAGPILLPTSPTSATTTTRSAVTTPLASPPPPTERPPRPPPKARFALIPAGSGHRRQWRRRGRVERPASWGTERVEIIDGFGDRLTRQLYRSWQ